jgi:sporulation protein YlmC with PRC-barrel domain
MRRTLTTGLCLALLGALPAYGQEQRETTTVRETRTEVRKVSTLMGAKVTLERGESSFGKVTDIVINESGCVDYLIVSYEDELVAVPWGAVTYNVGERVVTLNVAVTRDKLRGLFFRAGSWPNFREERWMRNMRSVWGERAFRHEQRTGGGDRRDLRDDRRDLRDQRRDLRDERRDRRDERTPQTNPPDRRSPDRTTPPPRSDDRRPPDRTTPPPRSDDRKPPPRSDDRKPPPRNDDRNPPPRTPPPDRSGGV